MARDISIKVCLRPSEECRDICLPEGTNVGDLVRKMGLMVEEHVVLMKEQVLSEFHELLDGDSVVLLRAFSGG